jgi:tRNA modification GTPase
MHIISNTDTICAIATPPGAGGIGVVRISGPSAFAVLEKVWRGKVQHSNLKPRKLYLGEINIASHESRVTSHDKVMAVKMPAPNTYTGQDVVELSCHGSQVVLKGILEACVAASARVAGPGEFTRRAFLAGKMDLAQAEAVADLIHATSERGARLAADQLEGRLSEEIESIASKLASLRGEVEASIDFPEEGIEVTGSFDERIGGITAAVERLADTYENGRLARDGIRVAIVGRPNSGKSSIMNRLAGIERALVHHEPGTTRDVIEECVSLGGVVFRLRDTAGMRGDAAEVESMGIDRAREELSLADAALVVFDGSKPFGAEDEEVLRRAENSRSIFVINKSDLAQRFDFKDLGRFEPLEISAKTGDGVDRLVEKLSSLASQGAGTQEGVTVTSGRHRAALDESGARLKRATQAYEGREPIECVAQHLKGAQDSLGAITGKVTTDELLDRIFSTFCIGK